MLDNRKTKHSFLAQLTPGKIVSSLFLLLIVAVPLTVFMSRLQEVVEQHAAGILTLPTDGIAMQAAGPLTFPTDGVGIYEGCDPANGQLCYDRLKTIARGGFKLVLNYTILYGTAPQVLAYLDQAHQDGLKVIFALHDPHFYDGTNVTKYFTDLAKTCNCSDNDGFTRYVVNLVKTHPALWGYYVGDELTNDVHAAAKHHSDVIHQADPYHPRLFINDANAIVSAYTGKSPFWDTADVVGDDYYPIGRPADQAPLNTADYTATVAQKIQAYADQYNKGSAIVLQAMNWGDYGTDPWVKSWCGSSPFPCNNMHYPTYDELRTMYSLALQNMHPRLVLWYSYFDTFGYQNTPMKANATQNWNNLVNAIASINAKAAATPTPEPTSLPTH